MSRMIGAAERRDRLGRRQHLARPAAAVEQVADDLAGLHSSDPATVYLAAKARVADFEVTDLEEALYEKRSLVRLLGMRRTMFVVPPDLGAVVNSACAAPIIAAERRRLAKWLESSGVGDAVWLDEVAGRTLEALHDLGEATANELRETVPELGVQIAFGEGKQWAGMVGVSTRVLFLLAGEGKIIRTRPLGTWLSSQYRWTPTESWIEGGLARRDEEAATTDLVARWLRTFGPGTLDDLKWWTGMGVRRVKTALAGSGAVEIDLEQGAGFVLPDDTGPEPAAGTWSALLPSLDPTVMGWKGRDWYLGSHREQLFDRNGNAGPTVWVNGKVVGGWSQAEDGEIRFELLEPVDSDAEARIAAQAAELEIWLGEVRIKPRFPTPLDRRLRS